MPVLVESVRGAREPPATPPSRCTPPETTARSSRLYGPAFLLLAAAIALISFGWVTRWGGMDFSSSIKSLRVVVVGPASLATIAAILVGERVRPAQIRPLVARGHRHDLLFMLLNATIVAPLVIALTLGFAEITERALPWIELPRVGVVPRWLWIALILIAMDACNWFVHFANHRVTVLWRFHELHHSQEDMSVLTVFRTHPLIHVSYLVALLPGVVLVANGAVSTTLLVIYAGVVAFAHSNTNVGFGLLGRVIVSPNYHRIHHKLDGPQDINLGFALTLWDQLFGRAVFPTPDTIRTATGLPGRPLEVEQHGARARHLRVFATQLVAPFRGLDTSRHLPPVREHAPCANVVDGGARSGRSRELVAHYLAPVDFERSS